MHTLKSILAAALFFVLPQFGQAADAAADATQAVKEATHEVGAAAHEAGAAVANGVKEVHGEHLGLPPSAVPVYQIGPFVITNSMLVTWIVAALIILFSQMAMNKAQLVPARLQNLCEWMVEGLYDFFGEILGAEFVKKSFWFFCSLFLFILFTNWFGLVPGVGTIGYGTHSSGQLIWPTFHHVEEPLLRGGNADLNMVSAMALLFFALWTYWSLQALGTKGFVKHIFAGEGVGGGFMGVFLVLIFFIVGLIEVVSIAFRPVSLSFRLYGNIYAGENILEAMMNLVPWLGWIIPVPFYFLELLVGLVQALVFALLSAVFTALMTSSHSDHGAEGHRRHQH